MTDPYQVLGVSPSATDEQIKTAYRELARKYHPDNYANNPLADLAQEKMKEINEAYDQIQRQRKQQQSYSAGNGYSRQSYGGQSYSNQGSIRQLLNANRISDAEELLEGIPAQQRDADWYYLRGRVFYVRGWLDQAYSYYVRANQMNPSNPEYQAALNQLMWQRNTGRPSGN